jgi:large subunit ribosomal protein L30
LKKIKIQLVHSFIGVKPVHRKNAESLGLKKIGQIVERNDSPEIWGMIRRADHLVKVIEEE